jgi:DNA invertase Pin-like site-specific DNA recombinase
MNCAVYVRVSTGTQDTENQLAQLRAFAHSQGWVIVAEYADELTGKNSDRAQFQLMFKHASVHAWDILLFWSLDRLSREGALETL